MDVSLLSGLLAERLLAQIPESGEGLLLQLGHRGGRGGHQAGARGDPPVEAGLLRPRLPRADHGRVDASTATHPSATGSARCSPTPCASPGTTCEALEAALAGNDVAAFFVEPIQGKGVNLPEPGLSAAGGAPVQETRRALRRRRGADRPRPHRASSWPSSTRTSIPIWCCSPRRCRVASCPWARSSARNGSSTACSTAWTAPSCTARRSARTTWRWRPAWRRWPCSRTKG